MSRTVRPSWKSKGVVYVSIPPPLKLNFLFPPTPYLLGEANQSWPFSATNGHGNWRIYNVEQERKAFIASHW